MSQNNGAGNGTADRGLMQSFFQAMKVQSIGGFTMQVLGGSRRTAIIPRPQEVINLDKLSQDSLVRGNADFQPGVGGTVTLNLVSGTLYLETCFEDDLMLLLFRNSLEQVPA